MSGAVSVPLAFVAIVWGGSPGALFAILAFVGLWVCVIRMGMANYAMLEKQKPKFKISCGNNIPRCVAPNYTAKTCFFRVVVESDCINGIDRCRGHLTKIEKDGVVLFDNETRDLPFAPAEADDSLSKKYFKARLTR